MDWSRPARFHRWAAAESCDDLSRARSQPSEEAHESRHAQGLQWCAARRAELKRQQRVGPFQAPAGDIVIFKLNARVIMLLAFEAGTFEPRKYRPHDGSH